MGVQILAATFGAMVVAGLVGVGVALRPRAPEPKSAHRRAVGSAWSKVSLRTRVVAVVSVAAGLVVAVITGLVVMALVVPAVAIGVPWLLSPPPAAATIRRLEAMEEWARSLAGVLVLGSGLEQAIVITLRSAPEAIRPEVMHLVARLRAQWDTEAALRAFADDLNDVTGDLIAANLIHAAAQRSRALAGALEANAAAVKADVAARRQIEAGRDKPRGEARLVTFWAAGFVGLLATRGDFLEPYGTPIGQVVTVALLAAFGGALWWLRKMSEGKPQPRFLGSAAGAGAPAGGGRR